MVLLAAAKVYIKLMTNDDGMRLREKDIMIHSQWACIILCNFEVNYSKHNHVDMKKKKASLKLPVVDGNDVLICLGHPTLSPTLPSSSKLLKVQCHSTIIMSPELNIRVLKAFFPACQKSISVRQTKKDTAYMTQWDLFGLEEVFKSREAGTHENVIG
ncbi:hypothetical protein BDY19DRAFT_1050409 [Irpex rosettiformis]|uniref:Uncharacterized protein n=1 Tax=Irpex rosettiformis TaxID=378272 RepID=A0ACB8TUZ4_9APHY|nr:hypothetical protein BDY19DRAFT_1050409 [Irpex rosettiformis]